MTLTKNSFVHCKVKLAFISRIKKGKKRKKETKIEKELKQKRETERINKQRKEKKIKTRNQIMQEITLKMVTLVKGDL